MIILHYGYITDNVCFFIIFFYEIRNFTNMHRTDILESVFSYYRQLKSLPFLYESYSCSAWL